MIRLTYAKTDKKTGITSEKYYIGTQVDERTNDTLLTLAVKVPGNATIYRSFTRTKIIARQHN